MNEYRINRVNVSTFTETLGFIATTVQDSFKNNPCGTYGLSADRNVMAKFLLATKTLREPRNSYKNSSSYLALLAVCNCHRSSFLITKNKHRSVVSVLIVEFTLKIIHNRSRRLALISRFSFKFKTNFCILSKP